MKLLLTEDDEQLGEALQGILLANGYAVTWVRSAEDAERFLVNAIRYTPAGGSVCVTLHATGQAVELTVKDNGPGIVPELQSAVFERFFRIPGSDTQGSGLGLSIVRRLAEAIGSSVHLGPGLDGRGLSVALSLTPVNGSPHT